MANNLLLASDNFASGSLAAGWASYGGLSLSQVVNVPPHVAEANSTGVTAGQIWTGLTWPNNQISEVTMNALTQESNNTLYLIVRAGAGFNSYFAQISNGTLAVFKQVVGVNTQIGSTITGLTFAGTDIWTFTAQGTTLTAFQNGGNPIFSGSDSTFTAGSPGFLQFASTSLTHNRVASWRGYNADVSGNTSGSWMQAFRSFVNKRGICG